MDASEVDWVREEIRRWGETFRASVPIDRWLEHEFWDDSWPHDVRREWDEEERWFWIIPDFERGRSRVVGVEGSVLREHPPELIQDALERANWKARLEHEHLLVIGREGDTLEVVPWEPKIDEVWFEDPRGGFYNAYEQTPRSMWSSGPPFLGLNGKTWSAKGPENPRPARTYTAEELRKYIPESVRGSQRT